MIAIAKNSQLESFTLLMKYC